MAPGDRGSNHALSQFVQREITALNHSATPDPTKVFHRSGYLTIDRNRNVLILAISQATEDRVGARPPAWRRDSIDL